MTTLYTPEPPKPPHRCDGDMYVGFEAPPLSHGSVIECKVCGQRWYAEVDEKPGSGGTLHTLFWRKVRWYHFDLKKKVRKYGRS